MTTQQRILLFLAVFVLAAGFRFYGLEERNILLPDPGSYYTTATQDYAAGLAQANAESKEGLNARLHAVGYMYEMQSVANPARTKGLFLPINGLAYALFGADPAVTLGVTAFFSLLLSVAVFAVAYRYLGFPIAIIAFLLSAISPLELFYGRSVFTHAPAALFYLLTFLFLPFKRESASSSNAFLFGVMLTVAFTFHPSDIFIPGMLLGVVYLYQLHQCGAGDLKSYTRTLLAMLGAILFVLFFIYILPFLLTGNSIGGYFEDFARFASPFKNSTTVERLLTFTLHFPHLYAAFEGYGKLFFLLFLFIGLFFGQAKEIITPSFRLVTLYALAAFTLTLALFPFLYADMIVAIRRFTPFFPLIDIMAAAGIWMLYAYRLIPIPKPILLGVLIGFAFLPGLLGAVYQLQSVTNPYNQVRELLQQKGADHLYFTDDMLNGKTHWLFGGGDHGIALHFATPSRLVTDDGTIRYYLIQGSIMHHHGYDMKCDPILVYEDLYQRYEPLRNTILLEHRFFNRDHRPNDHTSYLYDLTRCPNMRVEKY